MQQRVHKRSGMLSRACMDDKTSGLVHCDNIIVYMQDVHRNILCERAQRRQFRRLDLNLLATTNYERGLLRRAIHEHTTALDPIL